MAARRPPRSGGASSPSEPSEPSVLDFRNESDASTDTSPNFVSGAQLAIPETPRSAAHQLPSHTLPSPSFVPRSTLSQDDERPPICEAVKKAPCGELCNICLCAACVLITW